jgi:hypothetical protein
MKPWNNELIKSVIGCAVENVMFDELSIAKSKLEKTVAYLIKNKHVSDGQSCIRDNGDDIYTIEFQLKDHNKAVMTYVYKISPNKIEEVEPFNFDSMQKPLAQLVSMLTSIQTVNFYGGYRSLDQLHVELKDFDATFKKFKNIVKYEK